MFSGLICRYPTVLQERWLCSRLASDLVTYTSHAARREHNIVCLWRLTELTGVAESQALPSCAL